MRPIIRDELLRAIPSWDDVRFFLAIHRAGNLSAAAGPLGVTQPTCGRRLSALEASLGLQLFERTPEGLRITAAGQGLLEAAISMEQSAQALAVRAAGGAVGLDGVVRIATTELFASAFLVDALARIRERHPGIRVELVISNAETDLLKRDADIAVRFGPPGSLPRPQVLTARRLGEEPFALYASEAYLRRRGAPKGVADLEGHEVVAFSGRHPAAVWCARAFHRATVVLSVSSMQVVGAAISAGLGVGVLPERAARLFPAVRPQTPVIARSIGWLLIHPQLRRVPRIRAVVDLLVTLYGG
ncbi:MAG: LysR family transcriptional regulator [Myxococcaceae bacterium]